MSMNIGDRVEVAKIPNDLPDDPQVKALFNGALGKTFPIIAIDGELYELHIGSAFGASPERHRIWLDADHLKPIA